MKCEDVVGKIDRMLATRDMERFLLVRAAYGLARASTEVWWDVDPTPEKYISIIDLFLSGKSNKSKKRN